MSLEIKFQSEDLFEGLRSYKPFIEDTFSELELESDGAMFYPSVSGIYCGRTNYEGEEYAVIGLNPKKSFRYTLRVIGHEFGHDFYDEKIVEDTKNASPDLKPNGWIKHGGLTNDSEETVATEIVAALVGTSYSGGKNLVRPLNHAEKHIQETEKEEYKEAYDIFSNLSSGRFSDLVSEIRAENLTNSNFGMLISGGKYVIDEDDFSNEIVANLPQHIQEPILVLDEACKLYQHDRDYIARVLQHGWKTSIPGGVKGNDQSLVFYAVESEIDYDYDNIVWHQIADEFGSEVEQDILNDPETFLDNLITTSLSEVMFGLKDMDITGTTTDGQSQTPYNRNTDFGHHVGNWIGYRLAEKHDIAPSELTDKDEELLNVAQRSTDLSIEMVKENKDIESFGREIDALLEHNGLA